MNNSSELHLMATSITRLVTTITEIINAKVQAAAHGALEVQPQAGGTFELILTKRQLAARLNVSQRTIDNWIKKRCLPYYRLGRMVRFRLSDIESEWDAKHKVHCFRSRS